MKKCTYELKRASMTRILRLFKALQIQSDLQMKCYIKSIVQAEVNSIREMNSVQL